MKALALPTIQRRGAQRLATADPMLPVREANARAQMFGAIGKAAGTIAEASARYTERESKREVQAATLYAHEQDAAFVANYGGKEEFSIMDTEDSDFMDLADELGYEDPDAVVPSHRVYAEWRQRKYKNTLEEAAAKITNKRARETFMAQHQMHGQTIYAEDAVNASKTQIKYQAAKTMEGVEKSMLNRDFGGARLAVATSGMSEDAKGRAMTLVKTREQVDALEETLEKQDIGVMGVALDNLIKNDPATTSNLDAATQKDYASSLRSAINNGKRAVRSASATQLKLQADDLKTSIKNLWGNKPVSISEMRTNVNDLSATNPVLTREAEWAMEFQPVVSGIVMAPPSIQVETLAGLKERSTGDSRTSYLTNQLEKAIEQGQIARRTDATKWGKDTGFVTYDPVDYSSSDSVTASLAARVKPILSLQRRYGSFTGFLDKDELIEFGSRLENSPDKLGMFAAINKGLGEYAEPFYEQLKQYNIGESAAFAGQVMTWGEGYRPVAENILKGANLRKTDNLTQLKMKEEGAELDAFATSRFGGVFAGNKKQQSASIAAFKDLYAAIGDKEEAFTQITGGTIDVLGYTIQAPVPGMSGWAYKSHLKNIRPEWWAKPENQVHGLTPVQLRKLVLDKSLIQVGVGRGVSFLQTSNGDRVKKPDGVSDFLFKFDADAPTSAAMLEGMKAEQDAERAEAATLAKQKKATEVSTNIDYLLRGLND